MTALLNFAYGSNMLTARLQARTPSAWPLGRALLRGHRLHWHKVGRDGSGKCDIVATGDEADGVHGVVYAIALADKPLLDAAEGLGQGYDERRLTLEHADGELQAWAYVATHIDPALRPYDWYRALVQAGALEHGLPAGYVAGIAAVPTMADPDAQRAALHWALVGRQPPPSL
jgi:gamma-glutamylcyclotransferase